MPDSGDDIAIRTSGLTKRYGPETGVFDLDLLIRRGEVYGFLGPNGAGKSTTMRMLVGLIRPSSGTATVLGHPAGTRASLRGVGALIESPALYPHLSGRDNLRILAGYASVPAARVEQALEEVGMTAKADVAFRACSLGMKQRIAVGAALLKDPALLILDEPTNGLDPEGVASMRDLITGLRRSNRTVLLSSHQLTEVEHLCDRVGVIRRGRLVADGTVAELRRGIGEGGVSVTVDSPERAAELVRQLPAVRSATVVDGELRMTVDPSEAAAVNRLLVVNGLEVSELRRQVLSLEDVFFDLVEDQRPTGPEPVEVVNR
ncbi:ATP-binding cassette domain-containing protein [Streptomyces sp. NBC_00154]|uniref:ABC transporter ATP-binding protein n=1 Tax=Streptomyces sp. NBC_00154 TaxID=2975670 RepID=UPI002257B013|nr:ATP-binding cassette domain-containing protein [Streptomyces sp. NBC_00154]MCX5316199.1 ATP-binding cassette domain-containing protein [Streptomyces sp. NBC_00154]